MSRGVRRVGVVVMIVVLMLTVGACSASDDAATVGPPIQVNTARGPVTITGTPKRIVTLGTQWIDVTLSFGVTPVAYLDNLQVLTGKPTPWTADRLAGSTAIDTDAIIAQIARAAPDLILATSYMAQSQPDMYEKLSAIAPTIPGVSGKQVDAWQDLVTFLGTVLRDPDTAASITGEVDRQVDTVKNRLPGLNGKTYAMAYLFTSEQIQVLGDPDDGATYLFRSLGMSIAPRLVADFRRTGQQRFPISTENLPLLDADLLLITANTDQMMTQLQKLPGYRALRAVTSGAVSRLSVVDIGGINEPSPLSIPYLLDKLQPALEKAAA
ncbi:ABC transporter substrate-binding protein [Gordonia polyisoprenivorans]|uniref:ABC transporter substrate-binding protein n=1 Tax=Gordonia polyisoprenivorans TaxID=84595 RepID=UPI000B99E7BF|nr:ABC transporter substrate-binding protein [Gordonia polyisoprenivorans]OZC29414.1 ABC transporter substrate-binding protein [Gordonia polyisoprenivorans]